MCLVTSCDLQVMPKGGLPIKKSFVEEVFLTNFSGKDFGYVCATYTG
jgi:hypothetical protein